MKPCKAHFPQPSCIPAIAICFLFLAPCVANAECSEEEITAVFILENIYLPPIALGGPDTIGADLSRDTESFWQVDPFNCANLDLNTQDNNAWWCGTLYTPCNPDDPPEGYGNSWNQWLDWQGTVPDPSEPVTVTVRARMNLDSEPGYDYIKLQHIGPEGENNIWELDGFAEGLIVEQTFTLQPEDYTDLFGTVHLRWCFRSDGAWSDADCLFSSAGAVQIDLIEVFFDQGLGPIQIGDTETCEPGSDLQWRPEKEELHLNLLDVATIGPVTNPSIAEMIEAVETIQPGYYYQHGAQAGPFHLFFQEPSDFGAYAIVDGRDGRVIFAGTIVWLGKGSITMPLEPSHSWSYLPGEPADDPATVRILPNAFWPEQYGTPNEITDAAVSYLRDCDVLRSFSDCGPYDVVSFIYTPTPYYPLTTSLVLIVSGQCGPPWADLVSAAPSVPSNNWLASVYPNPFNPRTTVTFSIDSQQVVEISVFDLSGKRIAILADGLFQMGSHSLEWGGKDLQGNAVASGTYLVQMSTAGRVTSEKMMLIR